MGILNQTDLDVRLQRIRCCIASKGSTLVDKIKIGSKDVHCKLQELQVIEGMFEAIKCYNVEDETVLPIVEMPINKGAFTTGDTLNIYSNGIEIGEGITMGSRSPFNQADQLVSMLTLLGLDVSIIDGAEGSIVYLTLDCTNPVITARKNLGASIVLSYTESVCGKENCLTEEEVLKMIDYISTKCDLCFEDPGFDYES